MKDKSDRLPEESLPNYKLSLRAFRNISFGLTVLVATCTALVAVGKFTSHVDSPITHSEVESPQPTPQATVLEHLRAHEGLRLEPYQDVHGNWTIGYGHTEGVTARTPRITIGLAEELLKLDYAQARKLAQSHPCWPAGRLNYHGDDVRRGVLTNLAFNLGNGLNAFEEFTKECSKGRHAMAAMALLDSEWAHQVKGRAQFLAEAWATGTWPSDEDGDYKL